MNRPVSTPHASDAARRNQTTRVRLILAAALAVTVLASVCLFVGGSAAQRHRGKLTAGPPHTRLGKALRSGEQHIYSPPNPLATGASAPRFCYLKKERTL